MGLGSKVTQLISYLVVMQDDKTICLVLKCVADAELLKASRSQCDGKSGGDLAYRKSRASWNSEAESSVPFMVDGSTDNHWPVS
jgi:hypothetical protein